MSFQTIIAIIKAIPAIKSFWDELVSMYIAQEIEQMKAENKVAIKEAIYENDQRDLEKAIGSGKAGEASGVPDIVVVDELPGVHN